MTPFPRPDYQGLTRYDPERASVRLDLSDNTNLWGTHPQALERIRHATTDDLARYPTLYADPLRKAVSQRFGVDVECVTTGAGSDDVLDSAFRASFAPGATMTYAAPTFSMVAPFARMNGLAARAVPWPEALENPTELLRGDPALVYVCRPNNPTGEAAAHEWLEDLLEARGPDGPLVVVDEAYADFARATMVPHAPDVPKLLVARTASKAYGLAGLRCGFAVAAPEVALEIEKSRGPYKVSRLAAEAAAAAVNDADGWMASKVEECMQNRSRLHAELAARALRPIESLANFILFAAPTGAARPDALSMREAGVGVRPFDGIPQIASGLRVTVGPWDLMEDFLAVLDETFQPDVVTPNVHEGRVVKVALFDYGAGNLHSLGKALEAADAEVIVTAEWDEALALDALVLPGVGAFGHAAMALPDDPAPIREALVSGLPCLGICLGMQLLLESSDEAAGQGIGLVPGTVRLLDAPVVPHMGWNDVEVTEDPLFAGVDGLVAYYANSYVCEPVDGSSAIAWSTYDGTRFVAGVRAANSWGVQFHPEKSSSNGRRIVTNFVEIARSIVSAERGAA